MVENNGNSNNTETTGNSGSNEKEKSAHLGRNLYHDRVPDSEISFWQKFMNRIYDSEYNQVKCEYNISKAFKRNPLLRILKSALKNAGCPLDLKRHITCENCDVKVCGGYDYEFNQVVICKNINSVVNNPEAILIHELIHMYDYCVNELDFKNLEHLACTEIRAANLAHCSFLGSVTDGTSSPINIKKTHQYCVKSKAAQSLSVSRNIEYPLAVKYVLKVFDKCYNDLEPIGRRIRRKSMNHIMAEEEAKCFLIGGE